MAAKRQRLIAVEDVLARVPRISEIFARSVVSRRRFLQVGGLAYGALGLPSIAATQEHWLLGALRWHQTDVGVDLMAGKSRLWSCDKKCLPSAAIVQWGRDRDGPWLRVRQATPPRWTLGFDATLRFAHDRLIWTSPFVVEPVRYGLDRWLRGESVERGRLRADAELPFGDLGRVVVAQGSAALLPDLSLVVGDGARPRWHAPDDGVFEAEEIQLRADSSGADRALVRFKGAVAGKAWTLPVGDRQIRFAPQVPIAIDLSSEPRRRRQSVELSPVDTSKPALTIEGHASHRDIVPAITLSAFAVGLSADRQGRARVVAGRLPEGGAWFGGARIGLHVNAPTPAIFVAEGLEQDAAPGNCSAEVEAALIDLPGSDWSVLIPTQAQPLVDCLRAAQHRRCLVDLDGFALQVRRAHDLFDLVFSFAGLNLDITPECVRLVPKKDGAPRDGTPARATIRVHFAPQTFAEEAFFIQGDPENGAGPNSTSLGNKNDHASIDPHDPRYSSILAACQPQPSDDPGRIQCIAAALGQVEDPEQPGIASDEFFARALDRQRPRTFAAGPSRLVFRLDADRLAREPLTLERLLSWEDWQPKLAKRAAAIDLDYAANRDLGQLTPEPPTADETALEVPFRLFLSPVAGVAGPAWRHATKTPGTNEPADLWHTRYTGPAVRAIWASEFDPGAFAPNGAPPNHTKGLGGLDDVRLSMDGRDRHEIVGLTSVFGLKALAGTVGVQPPPPQSQADASSLFLPTPALVSELALSGAGAYLRLRGRWDPPSPAKPNAWAALSVEDWECRHPWGTEELERVVYKGFCFPLGIRVSLVKLTERRFATDPLDQRVKAVLFQRLFIVLPAKVKAYPAVEQLNQARGTDLRSVRFLIAKTPDLKDPVIDSGIPDTYQTLRRLGEDLFWPTVGAIGDPHRFKFECVDQGGQRTIREAPLLFVSNTIANRGAIINDLVDYYARLTGPAEFLRRCTVGGQRVGYAPRNGPPAVASAGTSPKPQAESIFETESIIFGAETNCVPDAAAHPTDQSTYYVGCQNHLPGISVAMNAASQPPFYPTLARATVRIPAIQQLTGNPSAKTDIVYDPVYVTSGLDPKANAGRVYARMAGDPVPFRAGGNSQGTGGIAALSTGLAALSTDLGLVGGPPSPIAQAASDSIARLQRGEFNPIEYFAGAIGDAKILGCIRLVDVLKPLVDQLGSVPRVVEDSAIDMADAVRAAVFGTAAAPGPVVTALVAINAQTSALATASGSPACKALDARVKGLHDQAASFAASRPSVADLAQFASTAAGLIDDLRRIANDPTQLVPAGATALHAILAAAKCLVEGDNANCWTPLSTVLSAAITDAARKQIRDAVADVTARAEKEFAASPLVQAAQQRIDAVQARFDAAATAGTQVLLRALIDAIRAINDYADGLNRAVELAVGAGCQQALVALRLSAGLVAPATVIAQSELVDAADSLHQALSALINVIGDANPARVAVARSMLSGIQHSTLEVIQVVQSLTPPPSVPACSAQDAVGDFAAISNYVKALARLPSDIARVFASLKGIVERVRVADPGDALIQAELDAINAAVQAMVQKLVQHLIVRDPSNLNARLVEIQAVLNMLATVPLAVVRGSDPTLSPTTAADLQRITTLLSAVQPCVADLKQCETLLPQLTELATAVLDIARSRAEAALTRALFGSAALQSLQRDAVTLANKVLENPALLAILTGLKNALDPLGPPTRPGDPPSNDLDRARTWLAPGIRADIDRTLNALRAYTPLPPAAPPSPAQRLRELLTIISAAGQLGTDVESAIARGDLSSLVTLAPLVDQLEQVLRALVPTKTTFRYEWTTALQPFPATDPIFIPDETVNQHLLIDTAVTVDLLHPDKSAATLSGSLRRFKIVILEPIVDVATITFGEITFQAASGQALTYHVAIDKVEFTGAFDYVQKFASSLFGNSGPYVLPTTAPLGIEAGFKFAKDYLQLGALTLQNIALSLRFFLPLDNSPATFRFRFASPDKPFLISSGIYGGGGFFGLETRATELVSVEGAFEFGAVTAISFGPLSGSGRVVAGIYFRIGGPSGNAVSGYVLATGHGQIAWFGISILLRVQVKSEGGKVSGAAEFSVSFEISSFLTLTFSFTASYDFGGSGAAATPAPVAFRPELRSLPLGGPLVQPEIEYADEGEDACPVCLDPGEIERLRKLVRDQWRMNHRRYRREVAAHA